MSELADRLDLARSQIDDAVRDAGRADPPVLIVVTKFHPTSLLRELFSLGVRDFGENRHQEAQSKAAELADLDIVWHFVGQLQSKKAKQASAYARVIHSLDRDSVVDALGRSLAPDTIEGSIGDGSAGKPIDAFVQVNLTADPDRGGVTESEVDRMAERVLQTSGLRLLGVMAVAPVGEDPRAAFARLSESSRRVTAIDPGARFISAGMSGDYREAILEGATHLRIGSAITGNRPPAP